MTETYHLTIGKQGRLTIPAEVRKRRGYEAGTRLMLFDFDDLVEDKENGVLIYTRDELLAKVQAEWSAPGYDAMAELIKYRRDEAARENEKMEAVAAEAEDETASKGSPPSEAERDK